MSGEESGALRRARGTGRLCKGGPAGQEGFIAVKLAFSYDLPPQPPHSLLVRREVDKQALSSTPCGGFMRKALQAMTSAIRHALSFVNVL
jgi:hypothetical protein